MHLELEDLKNIDEYDFGYTPVYQHAKNFIALGCDHLHQYNIETGEYEEYSYKDLEYIFETGQYEEFFHYKL